MKVKIGNETKSKVWSFLKENNIGQRGKADGNKAQQYVGLLGEIAVKRLFGISDELEAGFDGGYDFEHNGRKIDVKTMGRNVDVEPHFVNNFWAYQKNLKADTYIFTSLNKKTYEVTICGWIEKDEMKEVAEKFKKGTIRTLTDGTEFPLKGPMWEIKMSDLKDITELL